LVLFAARGAVRVQTVSMLGYAAITFGVTLVGGALPALRRWSHRQLHAVLALATGVFLGTVFLHLLPEIASTGAGGEFGLSGRTAWLLTLVATLAVYLFDALVFRSHSHDDLLRHRAVGYSALLGMSVHSLTEGIAFPVYAGSAAIATSLLVSTLGHKLLDGFSLASVLRLAELPRVRVALLLIGFAALTPAGMLIGDELRGSLSPVSFAVVQALAAGPFLFVALCELLPEVFHHREDSVLKVSLLAAGIGASFALHEVAG
jgi:zinc transporter ZupT